MLFDMTHKLIVVERLASAVSECDQELADKISNIPNIQKIPMSTLAKTVNGMLRDHLEKTTKDPSVLSKGCHPLSTPENWDAVSYWLTDISKQYVPALRQAKVNQNEGTTCT